MRRLLPVLALAFVLAGCTDAATRLAYQFEREAGELRGDAGRKRLTFEHVPEASPEGPRGDYTIALNPGSLSVSCHGQEKDYGEECYSTSYHRRFVKVPQALSVRHHAGEASKITIEKDGDDIVVVALE